MELEKACMQQWRAHVLQQRPSAVKIIINLKKKSQMLAYVPGEQIHWSEKTSILEKVKQHLLCILL